MHGLAELLGNKWLLEELGYASVFWTNFGAGLQMFAVFGLIFALATYLPLRLVGGGGVSAWALPLALSVGVIMGMDAAGEYDVMLLGMTDTTFAQNDPVFGRDLSFFVFSLPWIWTVWGYLAQAAGLWIIAAAVASMLTNRAGVDSFMARMSTLVSGPLKWGVVALLVLAALGTWLSRYGLLLKDNSSSSVHVGASFVDINGLLSTLNYIHLTVLLLLVGAFVAMRLLGAVGQSNWAGARSSAQLVLVLLLVDFSFKGAVALRDQVFVEPNEPIIQLESIQHHITATRQGARLGDIERVPCLPNGPEAELPALADLLAHPAVKNAPIWPGFSSYLERLLDPSTPTAC